MSEKIIEISNLFPIKGTNGIYFISKSGDVFSNYNGLRKLKKSTSKGYEVVSIFYNKKKYLKKVHRLVAEAFIPNPENKKTVNHKDFNKKNNNIDNLEWMSSSENTKHANSAGVSFKKGFEDIVVLTIYTIKMSQLVGQKTNKRKQYLAYTKMSPASFDKIASGINKKSLYNKIFDK